MRRAFLLVLMLAFASVSGAQEAPGNIDEVSLADLLDLNVVTAAKVRSESAFSAPGVMTVLTSEEIRRFGAKNFRDVLRRLNGVYTTGSPLLMNNIVSVRGDVSTHYDTHTLFLINGRPFRDSGQGVDMAIVKDFPVDVIDRVELIRGPGSVLYGTNAFSGVINVITKKRMAVNKATLGWGADNANLARLSGGNDKFVGGFHYLNDDGPYMDFTDEAGNRSGMRFGSDDNGGFASLNENGWSINFFQGTNRDNNIGPNDRKPEGTLNHRRVFVDISYQNNWTEQSTGNYYLTYNHSYLDFDADLPPTGNPGRDSEIKANDFLLETTQFFRLSDQIDLTVGGLVEQKYSWASTWRKHLNEEAYSGYMQLRYSPIVPLSFIAGAQGNKVRAQEEVDVVPRFGVIYNHENRYGAKILYASAFRSPTALERFASSGTAVQGSENLKPEHVSTLDVQLMARISDFSLGLTYFQSKYEDVITRVQMTCNGVALANCYQNIGEREINGFEFDAKWIPTSRAIVNLGAILQENEDNGVENAALTPNTMLKLGASYDFEFGMTMGLYDLYYSKPKLEVGTTAFRNEAQTEHHYITLNADFDLEKMAGLTDTSFGLYVNNLANDDVYHPNFNRKTTNTFPYETGRTFYLTLSHKF